MRITGRETLRREFLALSKRGVARTSGALLLLFVLAATTEYLSTRVSQACVHPDELGPIIVFTPSPTFPVGSTFKCVVKKYTTFGVPTGDNCGLGFDPTSGTLLVNNSSVFLADTNTPFSSFAQFQQNENVRSGFFGGVTVGPGFGSVARVIAPIQTGIAVDLIFELTVRSEMTLDAVIADLRDAKIGTDEADASGKLLNTHRHVVSPISVNVVSGASGAPTLSEWGVIIMALLLLTSGTIFILRRSPLIACSPRLAGDAQFVEGINRPLFVPAVFGRVLAGILALVFIGFGVVTWLSGPLKLLDIGGTILCSVVFAYMFHLLIVAAKDSQTNAE